MTAVLKQNLEEDCCAARAPRPEQLASWAGLTPKHHESDTTVHCGRITKQGSRLVRWAAVEAVQRVPGHTRLGQACDRVGNDGAENIGVVAAARELMTLVFYGLRDHHICCLATPAGAAYGPCLTSRWARIAISHDPRAGSGIMTTPFD